MKKFRRYRRQVYLLPIPVEGSFDRLAVDVLDPFPVTISGSRYVVVFSDYICDDPKSLPWLSVKYTASHNFSLMKS